MPAVRIILQEPARPSLDDVAHHLHLLSDLYQVATYVAEGREEEIEPYLLLSWRFPEYPGAGQEMSRVAPLLKEIRSGNSILAEIASDAKNAQSILEVFAILAQALSGRRKAERERLTIAGLRLDNEGKALDNQARQMNLARLAAELRRDGIPVPPGLASTLGHIGQLPIGEVTVVGDD